MSVKPEAYIFDLDGTLANLEHRLHHIKDGNRNWDQFFEECDKDELIIPVASVLQMLSMNEAIRIVIVSGRSSVVEDKTRAWLTKHGIGFDALFMRQKGDHRPDDKLKKEIFLKWIEPLYDVCGVFDDRKRVVDMWRSLGLMVFHVAEGEY